MNGYKYPGGKMHPADENDRDELQDEVETAFSEIIHAPWGRSTRIEWYPPIDLYETRDSYILIADLPGVNPERVSLSIERDHLVLCGERSAHIAHASGRFHVIERTAGRFCRTIPLRHPVNTTKVTFSFESGVYRATIPKLRNPS